MKTWSGWAVNHSGEMILHYVGQQVYSIVVYPKVDVKKNIYSSVWKHEVIELWIIPVKMFLQCVIKFTMSYYVKHLSIYLFIYLFIYFDRD